MPSFPLYGWCILNISTLADGILFSVALKLYKSVVFDLPVCMFAVSTPHLVLPSVCLRGDTAVLFFRSLAKGRVPGAVLVQTPGRKSFHHDSGFCTSFEFLRS